MKKILFIDEERWALNPLIDRLEEKFGKTCYDYCEDGITALNMIKINKYEGIILDMMMPLGYGYNISKQKQNLIEGLIILTDIRDILGGSIKIICYTHRSESNIKAYIKKMEADYLYKFDENSLDRLFDEIVKMF